MSYVFPTEGRGIAILFAVRKFHSYLYGREFILRFDRITLKQRCNNAKAIKAMKVKDSIEAAKSMGTAIGILSI